MDANRNVLWHDPAGVSSAQAARLTAFWGDQSWHTDIYRPSAQLGLFKESLEKVTNLEVADAFRRRLRDAAGFRNVPEPLAMRNSLGRIVYYLFFASQKAVANDIVEHVFKKYRSREV